MEKPCEQKGRPSEESLADLPSVIDDPVLVLIFQGRANTLHEAEDLYLNASLAEVARLAGSGVTNEELVDHPLIQLLVAHGSRGWEDSLL